MVMGRGSGTAEEPRPGSPHGPRPRDPVGDQRELLAHPDDMKAAVAGVELCPRHRQLGGLSAPSSSARSCPATSGRCARALRANAVETYWHHNLVRPRWARTPCRWSDGDLKVHGVEASSDR